MFYNDVSCYAYMYKIVNFKKSPFTMFLNNHKKKTFIGVCKNRVRLTQACVSVLDRCFLRCVLLDMIMITLASCSSV